MPNHYSQYEHLRNIVYEKNSILYWSISTGTAKAHTPAGGNGGKGYLVFSYKNRHYKNHRILFFFYHGYCPAQIDHKDRDPKNNKKSNLRSCNSAENQWNAGKRSTNKSGYKGVYYEKIHKKYAAKIHINKKTIRLGMFTDPIHAAIAYNTAARLLHKEFLYVE